MSDIHDNRPIPPTPPTREQVMDWLDYHLAGLTARRDDVLPALDEMLGLPGTHIEDDEVAGIYVENVRIAAALEKVAKAEIDAAKRPYLDGGRAVDGWRTRFMEPLLERMTAARARLLEWERRKVAIARAEAQARADAAAARAAHDASQAQRVQAVEGLFSASAAVLGEAAEASALQAMRAQEQAEAKPAALSRTTGHYGAMASIRTSWGYRVVDLALVPLALHTHDDGKIKAIMRDRDPGGRPRQDIPGIEWIEQQSIGVR